MDDVDDAVVLGVRDDVDDAVVLGVRDDVSLETNLPELSRFVPDTA